MPPDRSEVQLPIRGRPLRDRYVLRVIAVERAVHVIVLSVLVVAIFAFAAHRSALDHAYTRVLAQLQGGLGGPVSTSSTVVKDLDKLFRYSTTRLYEAGAALAVYTGLLVLETVGLWWARRWAEYLTFVETGVLVPYEVYELLDKVTALKVIALVLNLAVLAYLLYAHRLFGVRGGGRAEREVHERDTGWPPIERATPPGPAAPAAASA
ncbi:MAG TPA: DUF2127 domain-containing protein [Acidimicrobiales bacterium]|nr:DUF2127 domain-containing protein [Acidimicrobiales bacterium]